MRIFQPYLYGADLAIVTNHAVLRSVLSTKTPKGRIARCNLLVQAFEFKVVHKIGSANLDADALSRRQNNQERIHSQAMTIKALKLARREDPVVQETKSKGIKPLFSLQDERLFHCQRPTTEKQKSLQEATLKIFPGHPTAGHLGKNKPIEKARRVCRWPNMNQDNAYELTK